MRQTLKSAFTKFPHCLATYVFLVGAIWLLAFGWKPKKNAIPTQVVAAAEATAYAHASKVGGEVFSVSDTGSMRGTLAGGDFIVTVRNFSAVKVGDVLAYWPAFAYARGNPLVHRAVQLDKHGWIMSGDSAPHSESWARVTDANYIGTVVAIYRPASI